MKSFGRLRILKQLDESGTDSYLVHDPERGREILLHILPAERNQTNLPLWERLDRALPLAGAAVLDSGDVLGVRYVLTEAAAQFSSLVTLLESASQGNGVPVTPSEEPGSFTKIFKAQMPPVSNREAEPESIGAFTRMFQAAPANTPQLLEETASMPMRASIPLASTEEPKETGAFTRMFQSASPSLQFEKAEPEGHLRESEFVRSFDSPLNPPTPKPAAPLAVSITPPALAGPLGENDRTRLFNAAEPRHEQKSPPRNQPQQAKPEDFSNFFQSPLEARKGEVDFSKISPKQPPPVARPAGEFTRMFGKPFAAEPLKPAANVRREISGATAVFAKLKAPQSSTPAQPAVNAVPSEYTQMFGAQRIKAPSGPPAVAEAPANAPASAAQQKVSGAPVMLFVLLGVLTILAIALVLYFVLKR